MIKELESQICSMRLLMIETAGEKGLTHPDTVEYSQALDELLNIYDDSQDN
ncbi:sporulation protein Spo0E [Alteribacter lacisalsi]|uniref:Sporulation protein Spo0E n=1 Tax=Alteribacter lacisalsi TaxID=2045244 RepID=A0A2W0H9S8_9BACI|nr:aspartyl-phosphate phosphatase Spo0E family protein [Alteribacter lacisalsi]PYZ97671.1 sporulation protein Spo0E [Alteribacter lacisalsi]